MFSLFGADPISPESTDSPSKIGIMIFIIIIFIISITTYRWVKSKKGK